MGCGAASDDDGSKKKGGDYDEANSFEVLYKILDNVGYGIQTQIKMKNRHGRPNLQGN